MKTNPPRPSGVNDTAEAVARRRLQRALIAAAPDMLTMLHGVLDQQECNGYVGCKLVEEIKDAIARAEGRA